MGLGKLARGGVALMSALTIQPAAAATFVSGKIGTDAASAYNGIWTVDPKSATLAAPGSIAVSSAGGYNIGGSRPTISVQSSMDATWASATAGSFQTKWGWNVDTFLSPHSFAVSTMAAPSWSYTFIASDDGVFTMDYDLLATGTNSYFLWGLAGSGGLGNAYFSGGALTASGILTVPLIAGQTYDLAFGNGGNASNSGGAWVVRNATGTFDWKITYNAVAPVPEPSTWAMMICGLALVGAVMRRRGGFATLPA